MAKNYQFLALALRLKMCVLQTPGITHLLINSQFSLEAQIAVRMVGTIPFLELGLVGAALWWLFAQIVTISATFEKSLNLYSKLLISEVPYVSCNFKLVKDNEESVLNIFLLSCSSCTFLICQDQNLEHCLKSLLEN